MTDTPLDIGPRRCRDCRNAVPPPQMWRCADCLRRRIDRVLPKHQSEGTPNRHA